VAGLAGKQARNQRMVKRYYQIVTVCNRLEFAVRKLSSFWGVDSPSSSEEQLTVSAKSKTYHLIVPVQMSQIYKSTSQGTIAYIQMTGSKMFLDL